MTDTIIVVLIGAILFGAMWRLNRVFLLCRHCIDIAAVRSRRDAMHANVRIRHTTTEAEAEVLVDAVDQRCLLRMEAADEMQLPEMLTAFWRPLEIYNQKFLERMNEIDALGHKQAESLGPVN